MTNHRKQDLRCLSFSMAPKNCGAVQFRNCGIVARQPASCAACRPNVAAELFFFGQQAPCDAGCYDLSRQNCTAILGAIQTIGISNVRSAISHSYLGALKSRAESRQICPPIQNAEV